MEPNLGKHKEELFINGAVTTDLGKQRFLSLHPIVNQSTEICPKENKVWYVNPITNTSIAGSQNPAWMAD